MPRNATVFCKNVQNTIFNVEIVFYSAYMPSCPKSHVPVGVRRVLEW
ncbi:MAG: Hypothetical protein BHV28_16830 [Candidatus Tokpelaia hoelldobleri]|uniref:Uncharacterized protein n=1 Tax=Candidatus Tokpelaia hoelldobleri TaxID=1902579 RepID=A0A1U9JWX3_9HYPH|nr:MAG: Hypothetical protein BHV28_16830 [Candidatus Tokpelaia hoelldoblerii]